MNKMQFSSHQNYLIEKGAKIQRSLERHFDQIPNSLNSSTPHHYIQGQPGYGKTHTAHRKLKELGINYIEVTGKVSMVAFGIRLATIRYEKDVMGDTSPVCILVDDCNLFSKEDSINQIKNVLAGNQQFVYETAYNYSNLPELQQVAIQHCTVPGRLGFTVDTSDFSFVFLSNIKLPNKSDVLKKPTAKNEHLLAILDRCNYHSLDHSEEEIWGWLAYTVLNTDILNMIDDQAKHIILDWIHHNWSRMVSTSLRVCQKMADAMNLYPDDYKDEWEFTHLRKI